jgi:hypothetical protein
MDSLRLAGAWVGPVQSATKISTLAGLCGFSFVGEQFLKPVLEMCGNALEYGAQVSETKRSQPKAATRF